MRLFQAFLLAAAAVSMHAEYVLQPFAVPRGWATFANSINNRGAIVGTTFVPDRGSLGFKRDANGTFEFMGEVNGGSNTSATGISNYGTITGSIGFATQGLGFTEGFVRIGGPHGTDQEISFGGAVDGFSIVTAVNDANDFVGYALDFDASQFSFSSFGGAVSRFAVPGASITRAQGLAWDGTIVGCYGNTGENNLQAFLEGPQGKLVQLRVANAVQTCALGINNAAGSIVGYYQDARATHGFVYHYGANPAILQNAAPNSTVTIPVQTITYPGARDTRITSINAAGNVVGWAELPDLKFVSFSGTPGH